VTIVGHAGSSVTYATTGYRVLADAYCYQVAPGREFTFQNIAANGFRSWANLVKLSGLSALSLQIVFDTVNDLDNAHCKVALEALIRKIWTANAATALAAMEFFSVSDYTNDATVDAPTTAAAQTNLETICAHYSIPVCNFWSAVKTLVNDGANLTTYLADNTHPTATGHSLALSLLAPYLPDGGKSGDTVPARLYAASADYEQAPVITNGANYDSVTGTWTTTGTRIESAEANATATFSGTFRSFGCYRADYVTAGDNAVLVSIDGGAFAAIAFDHNGYDTGARAAHTIIIKVVSSCRIDEFWAI